MISNPWECPRCHKINAGWLSQCTCVPTNKASMPEKEVSISHWGTFQAKADALCQLCMKAHKGPCIYC